MYYKRLIDSYLDGWASSEKRKPLLLRGARQVGKSSAVRTLAEQFADYIEINFEVDHEIRAIFEIDLNTDRILRTLEIWYQKDIIPGKTLLFLDEIQSCPNAIVALRYFYEKQPDLHVIAAGSLLEFVLENLPTFGVGRIRSVYVRPFSFDEFLDATGHTRLKLAKASADFDHPLDTPIHNKLLELLKIFMLIGGMPEAVATWIESQKLLRVQEVLSDLTISYQNDFPKYKTKVNTALLKEVFDAVILFGGRKFIYSKASPTATVPQIKEATFLLQMAGLIIPIVQTSANGLPLSAESNPKNRKLMIFDTGIYQRSLALDLTAFLFGTNEQVVNRGALAEQFWAQEFIKYHGPSSDLSLHYWQREAAHAAAEVDYVVQIGADIIPVEIKSGSTGKMQSLWRYLDEKKADYGFRFSLENFAVYDRVKVVPLYAVSSILPNPV